jgi:hypothetical protein
MEQTCWIVERVDLRGINQFPPHGDVHLSPVVQKVPTCVVEEPEDWMGEYPDTPSQPFQLREFRTGQLVGVMAGSIRDLQILAQQHFAVRDPVIATDGAALN